VVNTVQGGLLGGVQLGERENHDGITGQDRIRFKRAAGSEIHHLLQIKETNEEGRLVHGVKTDTGGDLTIESGLKAKNRKSGCKPEGG